MVASVSFAVTASPLAKIPSPSESVSAQVSLFLQALIYAKEGSRKLLDGRWNLSQSESKLGITLSAGATQQLMACTGQIVCRTPDIHTEDEDRVGITVTASAASVLRPDLLVTAKHVFFQGKSVVVPFGACSFRSYSQRNAAIPILVEQDQRKGYAFNNEDFIVVRLKRPLKGCSPFALSPSDAPLREGDKVLSVTAQQLRTLNKLSNREPIAASGRIRRALDGVLGGPPFYYSDIDFDVGGSGGAVFALTDRRPRFPHAAEAHAAPVADDEGRLILRGLLVAYGPRAKNGRPYSDEQNYTIVIGLERDFKELVKGKAQKPEAVEPAPCPEGGTPKITVIGVAVPPPQSETLVPMLQPRAELANGLELAATQRAKQKPVTQRRSQQKPVKRTPARKEKYEFTWTNDTSCRICFTYNRCNDYGCWEEAVRLSAKSSLFAGVGEAAPAIKTPQFCK